MNELREMLIESMPNQPEEIITKIVNGLISMDKMLKNHYQLTVCDKSLIFDDNPDSQQMLKLFIYQISEEIDNPPVKYLKKNKKEVVYDLYLSNHYQDYNDAKKEYDFLIKNGHLEEESFEKQIEKICQLIIEKS